jgi:hypothetical protein
MLAQYIAHGMTQKNVHEWVDGLKCETTFDDEERSDKI